MLLVQVAKTLKGYGTCFFCVLCCVFHIYLGVSVLANLFSSSMEKYLNFTVGHSKNDVRLQLDDVIFIQKRGKTVVISGGN